MASLSLISLIVRDYDEALAFYTEKLGFQLREDTLLAPDKRWVIVSPASGSTGILLAKAKNASELTAVGNQAGGRVFLFLETDDFHRDHDRMVNAGVAFREDPRHEAYGIVAVFEDLYGNKFDLIERPKG